MSTSRLVVLSEPILRMRRIDSCSSCHRFTESVRSIVVFNERELSYPAFCARCIQEVHGEMCPLGAQRVRSQEGPRRLDVVRVGEIAGEMGVDCHSCGAGVPADAVIARFDLFDGTYLTFCTSPQVSAGRSSGVH